MDKQVQFFGQTESGIFCQALFGSAGAFEKTAGAPPFADWETGDDLRKFISTITKKDRQERCYTLVNALGAGEYFGNNINADYYPWNGLCHEGVDYGFQTFLDGNAFQHHRNKDPSRAFGKPVLSVLNTAMKRVELVVALDRGKAEIEGAGGILTRIDAGEFPDVSMGCKVPYDVCLYCGHRSKTKEDYCVHMKPPQELRHVYGPNRIMPNGIKIGVSNPFPRFFDISFVFIGADKTAKVMAKLASVGSQLCFGDVCAMPLPSAEVYDIAHRRTWVRGADLEKKSEACGEVCTCKTKVANVAPAGRMLPKLASRKKIAEIVKEIPTGVFAMHRLPSLEGAEPDLAPALLDDLSAHRLPSMLGGLGSMGVVLKPHEYGRMVLSRMGQHQLADMLGKGQGDLPSCSRFGESPVDVGDGLETILRLLGPGLKDVIGERSALGRPFMVRVTICSSGEKIPLPTRTPVEHPLLDKISAAYNGYRRDLLTKLSQATAVVHSDPRLREEVMGIGLSSLFSKQADAVPLLSLDSLSYLMGAHLSNRGLLSNTAVAVSERLLDEGLLAQGT